MNPGVDTKKSTWSRIRKVVYWITTGFIAYELTLGAFWDFNILNKSFVETIMQKLEYPLYFAHIMGAWKIPGAIVLVINGFPRVKEWVYAGAFFMYTGAIASHLILGDITGALIPLILTVIEVTSYMLRPPARRFMGMYQIHLL
ncbi:MAG TPA: DoxX family protein [Chitinophagaceae bacterium]|nr:DoxX family protein [Chitinophagaceae bacterium]